VYLFVNFFGNKWFYYDWWTHIYHIEIMAPCAPVILIIVWKGVALLPTIYVQPVAKCQQLLIYAAYSWLCCWLYSSINQQLFGKNLCNQSRNIKIKDDFHYEWKPSRAYHKIDTFMVSKDKWDKEEGTGNSMKNELYVQLQQYGKRHLLGC